MARGRMSGWLLAIALAMLASLPLHTGAQHRSAQVEAGMVVTGRITIERDGTASTWTLNKRNRLPREVVELVDETLPTWRFEPVLVDDKPVRGAASMRVSLQARRQPDGDYAVFITDARFGREALTDEERTARGLEEEPDSSIVTMGVVKEPTYPPEAGEGRFDGIVYLALRIDREGKVDDLVVQQVNLYKRSTPRKMERIRSLFAQSATDVAYGWTFQPPTTGEQADDQFWYVRVPVSYRMKYGTSWEYGQWIPYVAGPVTPLPWDIGQAGDRIPYALAYGGIQMIGAASILLTPLDGG